MGNEEQQVEYWAGHYRSWEKSGLSQGGYCDREGISRWVFAHWRGRVRAFLGKGAGRSKGSFQGQRLVRAEVEASPAGQEGGIVLQSPRGWQLRVEGANAADWARLLAWFEQRG